MRPRGKRLENFVFVNRHLQSRDQAFHRYLLHAGFVEGEKGKWEHLSRPLRRREIDDEGVTGPLVGGGSRAEILLVGLGGRDAGRLWGWRCFLLLAGRQCPNKRHKK